MKKVKIILAVILAAATMTTFSCNRDEDDTNNQNQQQQQDPVHPTDKDLSGTTWGATVDAVYHLPAPYNMDVDLNLEITFDFNDALNAELYMNVVATYPEGMGIEPQTMDDSQRGVYYFDGQKLYIHDADDYSPYTENDVIMTFNAADTTFTMPVGDPEIEEMMGVENLTLHLIHGTLNLK